MPAVVSDASVLIALGVAGKLELLREIYNAVTVPPKVWNEVTSQPNRPGATDAILAAQQGWLSVKSPLNQSLVAHLRSTLHEGEAQAIALATELNAAILLVDETDARVVARSLGIAVTGTIGVLLRAKRTGHIAQLKPILDALIQQHSFRLDQRLYASVLREAGEGSV